MKKSICIISALIMMFIFTACGEPAETEFSSNGFTITLTDSFRQKEIENYTVSFESKTSAIFVIKESFDLLEELSDYSLNQYAELVKAANSKMMPSEITLTDGLTAFEYSAYNSDEDTTIKYFTVMFKGTDAFWTVQFACNQDDYPVLKNEFIKYAKSVQV